MRVYDLYSPTFQERFQDPFNPGDHLRTPREGFWHHAIYRGGGLVVHFAGDGRKDVATARIRFGTLAEFADGRPIHRVEYGVGALPPEVVIENAVSQVGSDGYSLFSRNCEHFAVWAKTGVWQSHQVSNAVGLSILGGLAYAVLSSADTKRSRRRR